MIDGIDCPVDSATTTSVTCTTGSRPGLVDSSLVITMAGMGKVSTQGRLFRYVSRWSQDSTWGGEFAPLEGESVYIPKGLNLLVDVNPPRLNLVFVEGSLIFAPDAADPTHQRLFDAYFIYVYTGSMEVGTEEFPYTSRITITMHGGLYDPYIPVFGNKVIAVKHGVLDLHGVERFPSWTMLESTAEAGAATITL